MKPHGRETIVRLAERASSYLRLLSGLEAAIPPVTNAINSDNITFMSCFALNIVAYTAY